MRNQLNVLLRHTCIRMLLSKRKKNSNQYTLTKNKRVYRGVCGAVYKKHICPSGLRGSIQDRLTIVAWVRIPLCAVDRTFYTFPPRTFFTFSRTSIIPYSPYSKDIPTPVHHHPIISKSNRHVPYTTNKKRHVRIQVAEQSRLFLSLSRIIIRLFRIRSYLFLPIHYSILTHSAQPTTYPSKCHKPEPPPKPASNASVQRFARMASPKKNRQKSAQAFGCTSTRTGSLNGT